MKNKHSSAAVVAVVVFVGQGCFSQPPDVPRLAVCAQTEGPDGTVSSVGTIQFQLNGASIVSSESRRLPVSSVADGQCGDTSDRFEIELRSPDDRHSWLAFSLSGSDGLERPDVPDLVGTTIDANVSITFGFPDNGSAVISGEDGLLLALELHADNGPHAVGGLRVSLGEQSGPTIDAPCGIDHYHALKIEGDTAVEIPTNDVATVRLNRRSLSVRNLQSTLNTPDGLPCSPDAGGGNTLTWFAHREP